MQDIHSMKCDKKGTFYLQLSLLFLPVLDVKRAIVFFKYIFNKVKQKNYLHILIEQQSSYCTLILQLQALLASWGEK